MIGALPSREQDRQQPRPGTVPNKIYHVEIDGKPYDIEDTEGQGPPSEAEARAAIAGRTPPAAPPATPSSFLGFRIGGPGPGETLPPATVALQKALRGAAGVVEGATMFPARTMEKDAEEHPIATAVGLTAPGIISRAVPAMRPVIGVMADKLEHPAVGAVVGGFEGARRGGPLGALEGALIGAAGGTALGRFLNRVMPKAVAEGVEGAAAKAEAEAAKKVTVRPFGEPTGTGMTPGASPLPQDAAQWPPRQPPPLPSPLQTRTGTGMEPGASPLPQDAAQWPPRATPAPPPEPPPRTNTGMNDPGQPVQPKTWPKAAPPPPPEPPPQAPPTTGTAFTPGAMPPMRPVPSHAPTPVPTKAAAPATPAAGPSTQADLMREILARQARETLAKTPNWRTVDAVPVDAMARDVTQGGSIIEAGESQIGLGERVAQLKKIGTPEALAEVDRLLKAIRQRMSITGKNQ